MALFTNLPLEIRYTILMVGGLMAGAFANYLIYSWAYFPRHISPWAPAHEKSPARKATDRIPVIGWLGMQRETNLHGRRFWIRPMLVELGVATGLVGLYWFETQTGGLLPEGVRNPKGINLFSDWAHSLFAVHAMLFVLMVAATFIDFDEQTIPDIITLPGTLLALCASVFPWRTFLPAAVFWGDQPGIAETSFNIPWEFNPQWLTTSGLAVGLAVWTTWCFALTDRRVILRRGLIKAIGYFVHGIARNPTSKWLGLMWALGLIAVTVTWWISDDAWRGLFTSLIGLAVGGGTVWAVRIVASSAMNQEAMGFGDVTLMAMIGAVVGWQCAITAFFLAPFVAILIVLVQFAVTREPAVPFGPYLCAGTAVAVIGWDKLWNQTLTHYVELGALIFWVLIAALVGMGAMLVIWRQIKIRLFA